MAPSCGMGKYAPILLAVGLHGCSSDSDRIEPDQLETMFRAAMAQAKPSPPPQAACFGIEGSAERALRDPPNHLWDELGQELGIPAYPASRCAVETYPYVVTTGDRAVLYTVRVGEQDRNGEILFWASATYGNLGASGQQFRLVHKDGKWTAEPTNVRFFS